MGYRELIDALRTEGDEKVSAIWLAAEDEVRRIREEAIETIEKTREEYNSIHSSLIKEKMEDILSEAANREKTIRGSAEKGMSEHLHGIAVKSLRHLRNEGYGNVFDTLVQELPPQKWKTIRISPEDGKIARKYFPDSDVLTDDQISGGLEVTGIDGMIRIVNTFEKRLERAWMELLPELIKEIHCKFSS